MLQVWGTSILGPRNAILSDPWYTDRIAGVLKLSWCLRLYWVCACYKNVSVAISGDWSLFTLNISVAKFSMFLRRIETEPYFSNNSSRDDDLLL